MALDHRLASLGGEQYVCLATFRRDGTPVSTPVWIVQDEDALLVVTQRTAGKTKRVRHTSRLLLAPCDMRGRVEDDVPWAEGSAEVLDDRAAVDRIFELLKAKYGITYRLFALSGRLRPDRRAASVVLRITLDG